MDSLVFLLAMRTGIFAEERFWAFAGPVERRWRGVCPHQAAASAGGGGDCLCSHAAAAPDHLSHEPRGGAALGQARSHRPGEDAGRGHSHHRTGHHLADRRNADSGRSGRESGAAAGFGRDCRSGHRPGRAEHREGHAQRHPHPDRGPVQRGRHGAAGRAEPGRWRR